MNTIIAKTELEWFDYINNPPEHLLECLVIDKDEDIYIGWREPDYFTTAGHAVYDIVMWAFLPSPKIEKGSYADINLRLSEMEKTLNIHIKRIHDVEMKILVSNKELMDKVSGIGLPELISRIERVQQMVSEKSTENKLNNINWMSMKIKDRTDNDV